MKPASRASTCGPGPAPKGTPPAIIKRLGTAVQETLADPQTKAALETAIGGEVQGSTPEQMRALIQSQIVKWADVIKTANIPRLWRPFAAARAFAYVGADTIPFCEVM